MSETVKAYLKRVWTGIAVPMGGTYSLTLLARARSHARTPVPRARPMNSATPATRYWIPLRSSISAAAMLGCDAGIA